MSINEILEKLYSSFQVYYNIKQENIDPPFAAMAEFHTHDEQYFLVKRAVISEAESCEYVYFAVEECLDSEKLLCLDEAAWSSGMKKVKPHKNHRNTDITLIIVAKEITEDAFTKASKLRHYQSYHLGFQGWSNYRLVAIEQSSGRAAYNRMGKSLKKLVGNILND